MAVVLHRSLEADVGDALRDGLVVLPVSLPVKVFGWLLLGLPAGFVAVSRVHGDRARLALENRGCATGSGPRSRPHPALPLSRLAG